MHGGELPRRNSKLVFMASYIESVVPDYDIKQSDPLVAAEKGIGNCVAKVAIAGALLEQTKMMGDIIPAMAWNRNTHPKPLESVLGRVTIGNGHAFLLATGNEQPYQISFVSFNYLGTANDVWEVEDFNDDEEYATVRDGKIVATPIGSDVAGYVIDDWHAGGQSYMEALGQYESAFHQIGHSEMIERIQWHLKVRDVMSDFTVG